jgi:adenylate cyclase
VPKKGDKASIAVLPFDNLSGDPSQDFFSDGMTEEIITGLSRIPRLLVIARNSSFTYKGRPVKVQEVGRELGVDYVLEGSVRKSENRVRITAQLVHAVNGHHLWTERWDREMEDIFTLQDEITMKIMSALQVKLTEGEQARVWEEQDRPRNMEAYELVLQGEDLFCRFSAEGNIIARQMFERAAALDPDYTGAVVLLGWTYLMESWMGWSKDPVASFEKAAEFSERASALNNVLDITQALRGMIHLGRHEYDQSVAAAERAVSLSPGGADAHAWLAVILNACGRHPEALDAVKRAIRLNPLPPSWYYLALGRICWFTGDYGRSLEFTKKAQEFLPEGGPANFNLAICHSLLGDAEQARAAAAELLKEFPDFSLDRVEEMIPYKDPNDSRLIIDALRRAGLK